MKVKELIQALIVMPPDAEVNTEGCDCYGEVEKVSIGRPWKDEIVDTDTVYLMRPDERTPIRK